MAEKRTGEKRAQVEKGARAEAAPRVEGAQQAESAPRTSTGRRQLRTMAVLGVAFAGLLGACVLVPRLFSDDESAVTVQAQSLLGVAKDGVGTSDVAGLSWTNADGDTVTLAYDNQTWKSVDEPDVELDQTAVKNIVQAVVNAKASRTLSAEEVGDEMGLAEPSVTVKVTLEDGEAVELAIGADTADGSATYVRVDGSDEAYVVDDALADALAKDAADLYLQEKAPQVKTTDVVSLTIAHAGDGTADGDEASDGASEPDGGSTLTLTYRPDGSDASYTDEYTWFVDEGDGTGEHAADGTDARTLVNLVNSLTWDSCVTATYDAASDADDVYGLANPTLVATLAYTVEDEEDDQDGDADAGQDGDAGVGGADQDDAASDGGDAEPTTHEEAFVLVVGAQSSSGAYYAQPQGSNRVYLLDASTVSKLRSASAASLAPDDVLLMDWDTVDAVDIARDGETHRIEVVRTVVAEEDEDAEAADADAEIETTYTVDGAEVLARKVENLFSALDNLRSDGKATEDGLAAMAGIEPAVTFTFYRSTETFSEMTLSFTRYDNSFYLVLLDGEQRLLVNKNDVANLLEVVDGLVGQAGQDERDDLAGQDEADGQDGLAEQLE